MLRRQIIDAGPGFLQDEGRASDHIHMTACDLSLLQVHKNMIVPQAQETLVLILLDILHHRERETDRQTLRLTRVLLRPWPSRSRGRLRVMIEKETHRTEWGFGVGRGEDNIKTQVFYAK